MTPGSRILSIAFGTAPLLAQDPPPVTVDLSDESHPTIAEALGDAGRALDDWVERFDLHGFLATRFMDTEARGRHPDGFLGVHQALLFVEADVRNVGTAVLEVEFEHFRENDAQGTGVNEAYIRIDDVCGEDCGGIGIKVGRFDLPFGEYYLREDPTENNLIGLPIAMPYRWDEGILLFGGGPEFGFAAALTEGSYDRVSSAGIGPAFTARVHTTPCESLYLSASGHYANDTPSSAICFSGNVLLPVGGGAAGASPSATIDVLLGSLDARWQATGSLHVQASIGAGQVDDASDAFDREFAWWILEPSWVFDQHWRATVRWSGVSTFDDQEGYAFEGRPYANGTANYGYDLMRAQRVAAGITYTFAAGLIGKVEAGFDHLVGTTASGLPNATIDFVAAELVLAF